MGSFSDTLLGIGLYSVPEASRLTTVSAPRIRRWLRGYVHRSGDADRFSPPVWHSALPILDGTIALSFLDLVEVRFVNAFRKAGVPWPVIRLAAEQARLLSRSTHPFSTRKFRTDGRTIFAEVLQHSGEVELLDLVKSQYAFHRVISPSLYAGLEFGDNDAVTRWWPLGEERQVVIDPLRGFGQPIVADAGISTAVLADAVESEGSVKTVAAWFDIKASAVRDAMAFEKRLAA